MTTLPIGANWARLPTSDSLGELTKSPGQRTLTDLPARQPPQAHSDVTDVTPPDRRRPNTRSVEDHADTDKPDDRY